MEATGIKLFGKKITCHHSNNITNHPLTSIATATATATEESIHDEHGGCDNNYRLTIEETTYLEEERTNTEHSEEDQLTENNLEDKSSPIAVAESDRNPKTPITEDTDTAKTETEGESMKKPDKILPCPRCNSMDTKFCYYNNYNVKQPRHFCKSCQRYWTAGGTMRTMPVGAGRRKNKNPTSHYQFETLSHIEVATASNGFHSFPPKLLSFGLDSPHVDTVVSCGDKENGDDCSSESTVTTSNSVSEKTIDRNVNGFHSIPGVSWSYNPWNPAIPIPVYPSPYWNYIPWLPLMSPTQNQNVILGKHSRDSELIKPNGFEESKKQKNSVLIPKTLRIDDPDEAAKSSIWSTLGIKNENGVFKAFQMKIEENKKRQLNTNSSVLQANPAALSRSVCFQERA